MFFISCHWIPKQFGNPAAAELGVTKIFMNDFMCYPNRDIQNVSNIFHLHPSVQIMPSTDLVMVGVLTHIGLSGLSPSKTFFCPALNNLAHL